MQHDLAHPIEKIALWPTHLFRFRYRDWPYDKQKMLDCIYNEVSQQQKEIDSDVALGVKTPGLKESKFNFLEKDLEYPIIDKLNKFFLEAVADVVLHGLPSIDKRLSLPDRIKKIKPVIFESWYHVTNDGGSHNAHCHPGASWAGIFYIQTPNCKMNNNNGVNRWFNVDSNKGPGDLGSYWWNSDSIYGVEPEEGTLVLFPAWLWHDATAYIGDKDRIVIAFNAAVVNDATDT